MIVIVISLGCIITKLKKCKGYNEILINIIQNLSVVIVSVSLAVLWFLCH